MDRLSRFKKFYLTVIIKNLTSYKQYFNVSNFDRRIEQLINEFERTYSVSPFSIENPEEITNLLKQKKESFSSYSEKNGKGVPRAIINTHLVYFLKYNKRFDFDNLQGLVDELHNLFGGEFIKDFQEKRIQFNGNLRKASLSEIFGNVRDNYWTINKGSEKELQYHIHINEERSCIRYGLGFNAQKSINNLNPVKNISKFISPFISKIEKIENQLDDYKLFDCNINDLKNIKEGQFILFGKELKTEPLDNGRFSIDGVNLLEMYYDMRFKQCKVYEEIFESVQMIEKNNMEEHNYTKNIINLLKYKKQIILQGPPGTGKTRQAKLMAKEILEVEDIEDLNHHEQFKIVQFHPSYTYEDFVRGIVAEGQNSSISYKAVNKVLGKLAKEALDNYNKSRRPVHEVSKEIKLDQYFEQFVDSISEQVEKNLYLTPNVSIISIDEDAFRYKGNVGWLENGNRMLFKDIKQAFLDNNTTRQDVKNNENLSGLARWHSSYYIRVVNLFNNYLKENNLTIENAETINIPQKDYILVIDEINRANLSSVLGELIYALEYRGEAVDSMYEVEGSHKITLPPNLYIIGTMNTADRSVSQIDYAIRRRFAFVDVLPKVLDNGETKFDEILFSEVAALFDHYLSNEFTKEQVQIGHSYFIDKSDEGVSMDTRLEYEIKPILREYVRDGILTEEAKLKIEELKVSNKITQESDAEIDGTPPL
ncbi:McrB family protein [Riemerella anatipestifer]|uniref:McrB family protein n=1 Tax=Riemerella anatipestifer TaxID=34085 RepID=UPI00069C6514|nr:AAA family ATPase [Riemerella anatipestifer]MCO4303790.1 AAA family ATPase [Riemerella anatipestifer]MCO7351918.1 AAA family ATPase [Riemerella anatipestifer]MCQ4039161.1 AAA family ATPase [Riemerella anatipestifer]MCT6760758.1 AAA family ATPase [Riemerella anatipestifer]MCT6765177.1 AAA family ATPase [Riemerella anatipestifer]